MNPKHLPPVVLTVPFVGALASVVFYLMPLPSTPEARFGADVTSSDADAARLPAEPISRDASHDPEEPSPAVSIGKAAAGKHRGRGPGPLLSPSNREPLAATAVPPPSPATAGVRESVPGFPPGEEGSETGTNPRRSAPPLVSAQTGRLGSLATVGVSTSLPLERLPLPLAFQEVDPVEFGLSEAQTTMLNSLQASFVTAIGGLQQNAHDPRYADRWSKAQPLNDDRLRLFFGPEFVDRISLRAAQAKYAAAHPQ